MKMHITLLLLIGCYTIFSAEEDPVSKQELITEIHSTLSLLTVNELVYLKGIMSPTIKKFLNYKSLDQRRIEVLNGPDSALKRLIQIYFLEKELKLKQDELLVVKSWKFIPKKKYYYQQVITLDEFEKVKEERLQLFNSQITLLQQKLEQLRND